MRCDECNKLVENDKACFCPYCGNELKYASTGLHEEGIEKNEEAVIAERVRRLSKGADKITRRAELEKNFIMRLFWIVFGDLYVKVSDYFLKETAYFPLDCEMPKRYRGFYGWLSCFAWIFAIVGPAILALLVVIRWNVYGDYVGDHVTGIDYSNFVRVTVLTFIVMLTLRSGVLFFSSRVMSPIGFWSLFIGIWIFGPLMTYYIFIHLPISHIERVIILSSWDNFEDVHGAIVALSVVSALFWSFYFLKSRRVANTFYSRFT